MRTILQIRDGVIVSTIQGEGQIAANQPAEDCELYEVDLPEGTPISSVQWDPATESVVIKPRGPFPWSQT